MEENLYSEKVKKVIDTNIYTVKSRYDRKQRLQLDDKVTVIRSMKDSEMTPKKSDADSIFVVSNKEIGRPDIIAFNIYGDPLLYWVVLSANGLKSPFEIVEGLHLRLPSISGIYGVNGVMVK